MKFILGLKLGMTQIFDEEGKHVPVTLIEAGPCEITQIKTKDVDGYEAIQVGFRKLKDNKVGKSMKQKPFRYIREFGNGIDLSQYKIGDTINIATFQEGGAVKVAGGSKGKGFAGVVKKWGFSGRNATHGVKHEQRSPGSVGSSFPQRVIKGRKLPGRAGSARVTTKNLKIIKIDPEKSILAIKGALPGRKGTLLEIRG
ncbi:MAG: 50S ribosomal protein L3 [Parcubacteria group bacterium GW2011_GWA1_36_12]|nr:MAG: 50S ribosomal protein L3 [Parcubacteria group bacterium GW2011_GWA1_36_12]